MDKLQINGDLDIFIAQNENDVQGEINTFSEVLIHGNPKGLKSLAKLLLEIAELNQEEIDNNTLPLGAREHCHLIPGFELSISSVNVIIGRLDAKGTGEYYDRFVSNKKRND